MNNYNTVLFIGTGQIGKAILKEIIKKNPKTIIIHNLTNKESKSVCENLKGKYPNIKLISSFGNVFMPYSLKGLDNRKLYDKSNEIIDYFYKEIDTDILEKSTIFTLVKKYKPDLIIDAINTATVLGNAYNPEYKMKCFKEDKVECCKRLMVDDYTPKIINFVYSLKYAIETFNVKKYIKVSTTGLGGMGINMPYTHGDNPKINLSSALMGKIAASGVLHQLLWNLEHIKDDNISLIIPGTFVGYDSVKKEPIETDKGLLYRRKVPKSYKIYNKKEIEYNDVITNKFLEFPVVRAGENHVYSQLELNVLTAIGQMEGITKEEVANRVIDCIYGRSTNDILSALDNAMLQPTYLGREMIYDINNKFNSNDYTNGIATGNLGVTLSKKLYELLLIKKAYPTITELKSCDINTIIKKINSMLDEKLIEEIITLGIPIIDNEDNFYIGDYALVPSEAEKDEINEKNINKWANIGWVDLRINNIKNLINLLIEVYNDADKLSKTCDNNIYLNFKRINDDYDIAEYLAYYNNLKNKGRQK